MAENVALPPFTLPFAGIGAHVVFSDLAVVKYQNVERTRLELKKTELAAEIGRSTSSFWVPSVLAHDMASGSITFERMYGFSYLNVALSTLPHAERLIAQVGRALAAIHDRLRLPDDYRVALPTFGVALQ